jgi:hypothetical protein
MAEGQLSELPTSREAGIDVVAESSRFYCQFFPSGIAGFPQDGVPTFMIRSVERDPAHKPENLC